MSFNSVAYLVFLVLVVAAVRLLGHRGQNRLLLAASYFFYAWWDVRFLLLIVLSSVVDFFCALMIDRGRVTSRERWTCGLWAVGAACLCVAVDWSALAQAGPLALLDPGRWLSLPFGAAVTAAVTGSMLLGGVLARPGETLPEPRRRRAFAALSLVSNLGLLGAFKYFDFFVSSAEAAAASLGFEPSGLRLDVVLPVGISFYTFQTLSYTLDVYRGRMRATDRYLDLALYVAFFPQLVAGPIERAAHLLPEIQRPRRIDGDQVVRGLQLLLVGLFKKVAIADGVAVTVDAVYGSGASPSWLELVVATGLFALQIYCDFSGYSDIARGTAKLLGFDLMRNFDLPYFSRSPREFWRRWHVSLSTWLRDYLYVSLGGNRGGRGRTLRNLMLTMLLGGLWHGAAWNFVLWGAFHGAWLCGHRLLAERRPPSPGRGVAGELLAWGACMLAVGYGWLLFRAESLAQIASFSGILFGDFGDLSFDARLPRFPAVAGIPLLVALEVLEWTRGEARAIDRLAAPLRGLVHASLLFVLVLGTSNDPAEFIYFAF